MHYHQSFLLCCVSLLFSVSNQHPLKKRSISGPVISVNFPDPAIIQDPVDNSWYAFSSGSAGKNVPVARSTDFSTWNVIEGFDAVPQLGKWSTGANVWAPDVVQLADGTFVLYYSAVSTQDPAHHCIGAATSKTAKGPYTALDNSIACLTSQGGAIDPAGFADSDGRQYVVYKIDGNSIGPGGNCGNGNGPNLVDTPIMLQEVSTRDGFTLIGSPLPILHRGDADGPLVEAPSLVRVPNAQAQGGWMYILFFSSNCYSGSLYDTSYAVSVNGIRNGGQPYAKAGKALLVTGTQGLYAPGGLDVSVEGGKVVFHADKGTTSDVRQMYTGTISVSGQVMENVKTRSEYQSIAAQYATAKKEAERRKTEKIKAPGEGEAKDANRFKSSHLATVIFFSWIFGLHVVGIYFFTRGFLLTRLVLDRKSECLHPPLAIASHRQGSYVHGCWYPKSFDKAVVVIIDALRYDFTVPYGDPPRHFHNALTVLHETALASPHDAFLLPFIADPPTTTLQRLKGLTTGTLPTFIDAGSNFAGTAIEEDNLIDQLRLANKTLVHLGDDTWQSLFPGYFNANLSHPYDSFNVWDLHTVDNGVTEHLLPLLSPANVTQWDFIIAHYLGVDHAGHRYGPDHSAMAAKLHQMDEVLRKVIGSLDESTLLVVMGDHGMDAKGDHGGESDDEVEAALWMYSKKGIFGRSQREFIYPPNTAKNRPVGQIDLVPTLSLLLGMPIPFNNLGAPIEEAFIGRSGEKWSRMASASALTGAQIHNYQHEYAIARGFDANTTSLPQSLWNEANKVWKHSLTSREPDMALFRVASLSFSRYQRETLKVCRSLWARFDIPSMLHGIEILSLALVALLVLVRYLPGDAGEAIPALLPKLLIGSFAGVVVGGLGGIVIPELSVVDGCALGLVGGGISGYVPWLWKRMRGRSPLPGSLWGYLAFILTISQSIGFASNSYTIWEDEIMLFFLSTFAILALSSSLRQLTPADRVLGVYQSFLFLTLTRLASLSRLCREEQMPFCRSTYYASATSSTSATWQLLIPYALAIILPNIIRSYYYGTRSYEGSAVFWIGFAFRLGLLGSAIYWTIDAADDGDWLSLDQGKLKAARIIIAQTVLGLAFAAGTTTFLWASPCVRVETIPSSGAGANSTADAKPKAVTILGYANVHGSRYFLLFSDFVLAVILLQKPMGGGATGLLVWQILALLEIVDTNDLSQTAIGPIVLGVLGSFYFFKTGHQATLSSIQWDSAFVPLKTIRYPWSPLFVIMNTFGAQILTVIAVPLLVLWKQPPKKQGLLGDVVKAMATHVSYYAVINLATTMWAGWLRRHLMLYRIFSPRFMTGAAVLLVVDLAGILVALGGFRWNLISISEIFGWP
ncbi:MAG: hypothetical protein Q9187_001271 [Circinaria calcarea]